ncbi:MAG: flagellar biosynthesis regulator FlaF [Alphaproteobacteria bacterium]
MSLQAYQKAQRVTETPRDTEYRLFGQVTGALMAAKDLKPTDRDLVEALDKNRRVWSAMALDCSSDGNALPEAVRAQIISLSLWVSRYTSDVMRKKAPVDPLIDINRTIMEGLSSRPG